MRIAFQTDPFAGLTTKGDTTFALALEAQARGFELWEYEPRDLRLEGDRVTARAARLLNLKDQQGGHAERSEAADLDLAEMDVILIRQDPPFDMVYMTACYMLEKLPESVLVLNDPAEIRGAPEKLFVMDYPELMPPTLVTADEEALRAFRDRHEDMILKPLYGNGGAGVFRVRPGDENFSSLLEMFLAGPRPLPVIAQAYLKEVRGGDKRVLLLDGEPVGAINRVPAEGEARSNMHVGGRAEPCELSERDLEICAAIAPELKERRLVLTGIDVIGGYMTEINVTSPTGIRELKRFGGPDMAAMFWDWCAREKLPLETTRAESSL
ncbi:glutathione synthase [Parvularcula maris]|uniref:Glutathione synthetase n=1 Tax=Parvularcula maris TaxID=2965077 RepID=A0A9X2LB13_9PROT|nr:glutathione synthase [Parvularcula maris]MCQ8186364.1 glutathione synthase [Parvularcula maris]